MYIDQFCDKFLIQYVKVNHVNIIISKLVSFIGDCTNMIIWICVQVERRHT
jgi:hypothetical protein